jgi:hypothetical protein
MTHGTGTSIREVRLEPPPLIRNGRGLLTWRDGRCYEGTFQEDMAHGVVSHNLSRCEPATIKSLHSQPCAHVCFVWQGRFWILPEGVAGFQSCYDSLNAEGKTRVPTQDNPDRQASLASPRPQPCQNSPGDGISDLGGDWTGMELRGAELPRASDQVRDQLHRQRRK